MNTNGIKSKEDKQKEYIKQQYEKDQENEKENELLIDLVTGNDYKDSKTKYEDNMSSSFANLICGTAGIIILALNLLGVFKIFSTNTVSGIIINIVLMALFIFFIVMGLISFKTAKRAKSNASKESSIETDVYGWLNENLTKEDIDSSFTENDMPEEMKYFDRSAYVKKSIKKQFPDINEDFLDELSDKYIEKIFS